MTFTGKTTSRLALPAWILAVALIAQAASAHDIWVTTAKRDGQMVAHINYGDSDLKELVDPKRIVDLKLVSPSGSTDLRLPLSPTKINDTPVFETKTFAAAPGGVIVVSLDNGFWLTQPGDKKETNTSLLMSPKGLGAHLTVKYGKQLLGPGSFGQIAGARGEFIVLKDPYTLAPGEKLPVRVVIDGKPIAGTRVRYSDGIELIHPEKVPFVKTNDDGVAEIPLARKGPYMIATDPNVDPMHPELAEVDHVYVALSFDLSQ
ncbi:MAG: DUF4198 domain-containing protein [Rhodospirillaceae bacterium]|nr:DUF4198 domain-containing protein [Rhodospirillaceae bacterium]